MHMFLALFDCSKRSLLASTDSHSVIAMKQYCVVGDIVSAVDNGKLYDAKVLRAENVGAIWKYFVHFQGWDRKYDTWMDESMVIRHDDKAKLEKLSATVDTSKPVAKKRKKADSSNSDTGNGSAATTTTNDEGTGVKTEIASSTKEEESKASSKRKADASELESLRKHRRRLALQDLVDEDDENFVAKLVIPPVLKKHLVDEYGLITNQDAPGRLLQLPKPKELNVDAIVKGFLDQRISKLEGDAVQIAAYEGLFEGLLLHFDKALPTILLYKHERAQYDKLVEAHPKMSPCQLYGAEHLVRLFVRMPRLLSNVFLPPAEVTQILAKITELLKFMGKMSGTYVDASKYVPAGEAMEKIADLQ